MRVHTDPCLQCGATSTWRTITREAYCDAHSPMTLDADIAERLDQRDNDRVDQMRDGGEG